MGLIYTAARKPPEAASYLEQAMQQAEERNDLSLMLKSYQAFSTYHRLLGGEDNLTKAIRLSNRIIKLATEGGYFEHELLGHYLRGANFFELRNVQKSLESSNKAIALIEQSKYIESAQISTAQIYYTHSRIVGALGQIDTAQTYLQKAYDETTRKANLITDERQRLNFLSNVPLNQEIMMVSRRLLPNVSS